MSRGDGGSQRADEWRGTTADERAAERRSRLLDAAFELLATEGAPGVTVRAVVRVSGLSPRFFYESFADRDTLLLTLWDEQYADVVAHVMGAVGASLREDRAGRDSRDGDAPDFAAGLRAALIATADWFEERPARAAVMLHQTLAEPLLREHAQRRLPELVQATMAIAVGPEAIAALPESALQIAVVGLSGAVLNLFLEWTAGRLDVGSDVLAEAIVQVAASTLRGLLPG